LDKKLRQELKELLTLAEFEFRWPQDVTMTIHLKTETFDSGQSIAQSGHYKIFHKAHHLRRDIGLLKGNFFPRCASCSIPVHFQLTQGLLVESASERFRLLSN
jgi:hypothetical protein